MKHPLMMASFGVSALLIAGLSAVVGQTYVMNSAVGFYKADDDTRALSRFKILAYLGNHTAQSYVGEIYAVGQNGITEDDAKAIYWFERASFMTRPGESRAAEAELGISKAYEGGNGVLRDDAKSLKWLKLAADGGSVEAKQKLSLTSH
jgi:TPR repeat protein